ncbi:DUF4352 domain-containing protein [Ectobacillus funiculus]|uniref:DUF4352 domain-containing protein n=1 Tax=Ectobacillus funiculus TaxID=137993 RepID=A0ABV5WCH6_9BACI
MKKKLLFVPFATAALLLAAGCSSSSKETASKPETSQEAKKESKVLKQEDMQKVVTDPGAYKGDTVEFYGRVFVEPERDQKGVYLQMYALNKGKDGNAIVGYADPNFDVKNGDILYVKGTVEKAFEGENAMGGKITAPLIKAKEVKKSDYGTAFAPAKKSVDVNQEQNQSGFKVTVKKLEVAEDETRVYVSVANESNAKINFYPNNAKLIQNGKQLELADSYDKGYPEIQTDILPGTTTEGVLVYPAIADSGSVQLYAEGYSDNYEVDIKPFQYTINY